MFINLTDAFIKSDLHCIEGYNYISSCIPWVSLSWYCYSVKRN